MAWLYLLAFSCQRASAAVSQAASYHNIDARTDLMLAHEFKPVLRTISPRAEANQARFGVSFAAIPPRVNTQIRGRRVDDEVHRPVEEGWRRTD